MEYGLITFPELRHPVEVGKTSNLKHFLYHWLKNHSMENGFVVRGKTQELIDN